MVTTVMPTYGRIDIAFERGEGPYLYSTEGRRFLDFASGIATNSLGHAHPHLVETLKQQSEKLWHVSNLYEVPEQKRLADRLVANSFADTVFFANSGAEANEGALKIARKYQWERGAKERQEIVCCTSAFHGRTLTTLSAGDNETYRTGFGPRPEGFRHVAFGNMNEMREAMGPKTAAILVEPIQGEGGINTADVEYLKALRQAADEFDALLIFDEIQCGMGRTGKLWAYEWAGVEPDIMTLAKGLGGGFPVGAILASEKAASGMAPGTHGSTFGGNPLAMAVANAVLDVLLEPGLLDRVAKLGDIFRTRLVEIAARHPKVIAEVKGKGLMIGLSCVVTNADLQGKLREAGLLTVGAAGNVLRILPPLIIDESHVAEACDIIEKVCAGMDAG
ncbi:aspartate aminotransferase family protein [Nisaea acidiphila]|uniref:Acetylornithine aminotransferase n=1 Tax=Nisaea acidiphila TaxID=1862145 RepID=A0A9J7AYS2_9PROT|nr:aspartate aminotransferase family protein [Nisaea acidiphila]UUX51938.1 aspartate aminotransferase family protein [Nisaea acidiphila]